MINNSDKAAYSLHEEGEMINLIKIKNIDEARIEAVKAGANIIELYNTREIKTFNQKRDPKTSMMTEPILVRTTVSMTAILYFHPNPENFKKKPDNN